MKRTGLVGSFMQVPRQFCIVNLGAGFHSPDLACVYNNKLRRPILTTDRLEQHSL